uniref:Putative secreted protein n=1 Tax=Anopheles darlingi TaxID=43151 RepID=A0A2M4DHT2_ANODA
MRLVLRRVLLMRILPPQTAQLRDRVPVMNPMMKNHLRILWRRRMKGLEKRAMKTNPLLRYLRINRNPRLVPRYRTRILQTLLPVRRLLR